MRGTGPDIERNRRKAQLSAAVRAADDPLEVYYEFVQWTVSNYGEHNSSSGLVELLQEATEKYKKDPTYKGDLRYLKLWMLLAKHRDSSGADKIYAFLLHNGIGTSMALLYEDCATMLESVGKLAEAQRVYRKGIRAAARPLDRLKTTYSEFKSRHPELVHAKKETAPHASHPPKVSVTIPSPGTKEFRYAAMLAPPAPGKRQEKFMFDMSLLWSDGVEYCIEEARARSLGLLNKSWPVPHELLAREGGIGNAPVSSPANSSSSTVIASPAVMPVDFNDDGSKGSNRTMGSGRRRSYAAEPTVTINTKEALADVLGMFNSDSPEKTRRLMAMKKVDSSYHQTPTSSSHYPPNENNPSAARTPGGKSVGPPESTYTDKETAFRPFVDENASFQQFNTPSHGLRANNENSSQVRERSNLRFTPFTDSENPPQSVSQPPRTILQQREMAQADENAVRTPGLTPGKSSIFSAPPPSKAPLRDVFTEDYGKPSTRMPQHERAKSHHSVFSNPDQAKGPVFTRPTGSENALKPTFGLSRTPFGDRPVFRRPSSENMHSGSAFTPRAAESHKGPTPITPGSFAPFIDEEEEDEQFGEGRQMLPAFTPYRDGQDQRVPSQPAFTPFRDEEDRTSHSFDNSAAPSSSMQAPLADDDLAENGEEDMASEPPHQSYVEENQEEEYEDDFQYDDEGQELLVSPHQYDEFEEPLAEGDLEGDGYVPQEGDNPLRRFGQFTVMTPITERTFELTGSVNGYSDGTQTGSHSKRLDFVLEDDEEGATQAEYARALAEARADMEDHPNGVHEEQDLAASVSKLEKRTGALSLTESMTRRSNFRPQNPCNPYAPEIQSTLLSFVSADNNLHDLAQIDGGHKERLDKGTKKARKASGNGNVRASASGFELTTSLPLTLEDGQRFMITEKLGEGAFGSVFKARDQGIKLDSAEDDSDMDDDSDMEDEELTSVVALKIVRPRDIWEYQILRRLHSSLSLRLRDGIVLPHALYAFRDESLLVMQYCPHGTLLNIVNNANSAGIGQQGACLDELLVFFFAIELLRLVEGMHEAGFIHGDLKIDNCLVRLEDVPGGASAWQSQYSSAGEGGWSHKGLKVIDFGRAIDTRLFPQGQEYVVDWKGDEKDCPAIREGRSWSHETDYFGLATIVYTMLFGKHVDSAAFVEAEGSGWKVGTSFKRYWQTELWIRLFDILLNGQVGELNGVREDMERWLVANCNRTSGTLKGLLKKVELACI